MAQSVAALAAKESPQRERPGVTTKTLMLLDHAGAKRTMRADTKQRNNSNIQHTTNVFSKTRAQSKTLQKQKPKLSNSASVNLGFFQHSFKIDGSYEYRSRVVNIY